MDCRGVWERPQGHKARGVNARGFTQASRLRAIRNPNTVFDQTEVGCPDDCVTPFVAERTDSASPNTEEAEWPPALLEGGGRWRQWAQAPTWDPPCCSETWPAGRSCLLRWPPQSLRQEAPHARLDSVWGSLGRDARPGWVNWGRRCPGFGERRAQQRVRLHTRITIFLAGVCLLLWSALWSWGWGRKRRRSEGGGGRLAPGPRDPGGFVYSEPHSLPLFPASHSRFLPPNPRSQ